MTATEFKASVVIPTYNGIETIVPCLEKVLNQNTDWPYEVYVVDSGSTDGTLDFLTRLPITLDCISQNEFGHGRTRNHAVSRTRGDYIVFLVQDAEPVTGNWLQTLVETTERLSVAGAFGQQIPRPNASFFTKRQMENTLPDMSKSQVKVLDSGHDWYRLSPRQRYELTFFHDANSCVSRDCMLDFPYLDVSYGEDLDWAKRVLLAGHGIAYVPDAKVIHSHDRSMLYDLKRAYADHSLAKQLFELTQFRSLSDMLRVWLWDTRQCAMAIRNLRRPIPEQAALLVHAASHSLASCFGAYLGSTAAGRTRGSRFTQHLDRLMRTGV